MREPEFSTIADIDTELQNEKKQPVGQDRPPQTGQSGLMSIQQDATKTNIDRPASTSAHQEPDSTPGATSGFDEIDKQLRDEARAKVQETSLPAPPPSEPVHSGEGLTGILGDVARATWSGFLRGAGGMERAVEWAAPEGSKVEKVARDMAKTTEWYRQQYPGLVGESRASIEAREKSAWNPRGWIYPGVESTAMMAGGLATGALATMLDVPLWLAGLLGSAFTASQFWGDTAQQSYDTAKLARPDLSEGELVSYANRKGFIEGGIEAVQNLIPFGIARKLIPAGARKNLVRAAAQGTRGLWGTVKAIGRDIAKTTAEEAPLEVLQEYLGGKEDERLGLRDEMTLREAAKVIGPTFITSSILAFAPSLGNVQRRNAIARVLSDPDASLDERVQAVNEVYNAVVEEDKELADEFLRQVSPLLRENRPIPVKTDEQYLAESAENRAKRMESARKSAKIDEDYWKQYVPNFEYTAPDGTAIDPNDGPLSKAATQAPTVVKPGEKTPPSTSQVVDEAGIGERVANLLADKTVPVEERQNIARDFLADKRVGDVAKQAFLASDTAKELGLAKIEEEPPLQREWEIQKQRALAYNRLRNKPKPELTPEQRQFLEEYEKGNESATLYPGGPPVPVEQVPESEAKEFEREVDEYRWNRRLESIRKQESARAADVEQGLQLFKDKNVSAAVKRSARARAKSIIADDPVYTQIDEIARRGGIDLSSLPGEHNRVDVEIVRNRFPGVLKDNGKLDATKLASEFGYSDQNELFERLSVTRPADEIKAQVLKSLVAESSARDSQLRKSAGAVRYQDAEVSQTYPASDTEVAALEKRILEPSGDERLSFDDMKAVIDDWRFTAGQKERLLKAARTAAARLVAGERATERTKTRKVSRRARLKAARLTKKTATAASPSAAEKPVSEKTGSAGAGSPASLPAPGSFSKQAAAEQEVANAKEAYLSARERYQRAPTKKNKRRVEEAERRLRKARQSDDLWAGDETAPVAPKTETVTDKDSVAHGQTFTPEPSEKQKEAGNYKKAHVNLDGLDISIENPAGSTRSGTDANGKPWSVTMENDYGYIKGTVGYDKDHLDVFIAKGYKGGSNKVYVVNQVVPGTKKFDEHKVILGAKFKAEARMIYMSNYEPGWNGGDNIVVMTMDEFKDWAFSGGAKKGRISQKNFNKGKKKTESKPDTAAKKETATRTSEQSKEKGRAAGLTAKEKFIRDLERKGVAVDGAGVTIKIMKNDFTYYIQEEHNGARVEHGPGYPATWSLEEAREEAIKRAMFMEQRPGKKEKAQPAAQEKEPGEKIPGQPKEPEQPKEEAEQQSKPAKQGQQRERTPIQSESPVASATVVDDVLDIPGVEKRFTRIVGVYGPPSEVTYHSLSSETYAFLKSNVVSDGIIAVTDIPENKALIKRFGTIAGKRGAQVRADALDGGIVSSTIGKAFREAEQKGAGPFAVSKVMNFGGTNLQRVHTDDGSVDLDARKSAYFLKNGYTPVLVDFGNDQRAVVFLKNGKSAALLMPRVVSFDSNNPHDAEYENSPLYTLRTEGGVQDARQGAKKPVAAEHDTGVEDTGRETLETVEAESSIRDEATQRPEGRGTERSEKGAQDVSAASETGRAGTRGKRDGDTRVRAASSGTRGTGESGGVTEVKPKEAPPAIPRGDFKITDELELGKGSVTRKFQDNIAAIKVLKTVQKEGRPATPEEQAILARYVGWGGMPQAFRNPITGEITKGWKDRVAELEGLLTEEELAVARNSTKAAHYTSQDVVEAMWNIAHRLGFRSGNVLEPSVGTGNFLGLIPDDLRGATTFLGVEYDNITAGIAKLLYPNQSIIHSGFEKVPLPADTFDLVIGNPPFGQDKLTFNYRSHLNKYTIHNQFFLAAMENLAPGKHMVMVVSRFLMDSKNAEVRQLLARKADLVAAIRLPDSAFSENARTDVVTDILVFKKKTDEEQEADSEEYPSWVSTTTIPDPLGGDDIVVNKYFAEHPEQVIGVIDRSGKMQFQGDVTVRLDDVGSFRSLLDKAVSRIPEGEPDNVVASEKVIEDTLAAMRQQEMAADLVPGNISLAESGDLVQVVNQESGDDYKLTTRILKPGVAWSPNLELDKDGKWYRMVPKTDESGNKIKEGNRIVYEREVFESDEDLPASMRLTEKGYRRLLDAVKIVRLVREQIALERNSDATEQQIEKHRKKLRRAYDRFVKDHGYMNDPATVKLVGGMKSDAPLLYALETNYQKEITPRMAKKLGVPKRKASAEPADILNKRVFFPEKVVERAENAVDALSLSLSDHGRVDLEYIANLTGTSKLQVIAELFENTDDPLIFKDPETGRWETKDNYLNGNVIRKLEAAKAALPTDSSMEKNIKALEAVQPEKWGAENITPVFGASWIPADVYQDFVQALTGDHQATVVFHHSLNKFEVECNNSEEFSTPRRTTEQLVSSILNSTPIKVTSDGKFDQQATEEAKMVADQIVEKFDDWIFLDDNRRERLVEIFNKKFNTIINRQRSGEHLRFPGMNKNIKLRRHQVNAVWRGITDRVVLYDHAVGAGKAQPLSAVIQTPDGPTRMGAIQVGDLVIAEDGQPTEVVGVYPQGRKEIYRLRFSDGTSTRCCAEHLWRVRRDGDKSFRRFTLQQIIDHGFDKFVFPLTKPVAFRETPLVQDGATVGETAALWGLQDPDAYLDHVFMRGSITYRRDLINQVVKLAGYIVGNEFKVRTVSARMAECYAQIVRSLGGIALVDDATCQPTKRSTPIPFYVVRVQSLPGYDGPLGLDESRRPEKRLISVEVTGNEFAQCIAVAHPKHTYLTDDYIVTHNTFVAIARAMERKRMGLSRKPMAVVPNHIVEQFGIEAMRLYPSARILVATKKHLEAKRRRNFFAAIATGDWDLVIVPHSAFQFIPLSPETELGYLKQEEAKAIAAVVEARRASTSRNSFSVKEAERLRDKIRARIQALQDRNKKKDRVITFEEMGIDDLTVDESHEFKNLFYNSSLNNVAGMNPRTGSNRAYDLWSKVRYLHDIDGGVAFMTGTPISNSAVEMYTLMRYLVPQELDRRGIEHFDAWRANYTTISTKYEPTESGRGLKQVNRLGREWSNMRSLMELYHSFADTVTNDDIRRWHKEDTGQEFPIPRVKGGGRQAINVEPTPAQERIIEEIVNGFDSLHTIEDWKERGAERLRLMDRARKVALDARFVDPSVDTDEKGGKLEVVADNIVRIYKKWDEFKGTQLVFLDRSIPKANSADKARYNKYKKLLRDIDKAHAANDMDRLQKLYDRLEKYDENEMREIGNSLKGGWNAYQQIKDNLVKRGIPESEIAFIHSANTDQQKQELFDMVNSGAIRILLGSTPKMGAGTNVQERLVALHHVDVTWKPSDIEQREGRIIRQGNRIYEELGHDNFEVEILAYTTNTTVDAKLWNINATKLRMINGIRHYTGSFNMEFEDEDALGMAEIAAIASGDPLQLERVQLSAEIEQLQRQRKVHLRRLFGHKSEYRRAKTIIDSWSQRKHDLQNILDTITRATKGIKKIASRNSVLIDGVEYGYKDRELAKETIIDKLYLTTEERLEGTKKVSVKIDGKKYTNTSEALGYLNNKFGLDGDFIGKVGKKTFLDTSVFFRRIAADVRKQFDKITDTDQTYTLVKFTLNGLDGVVTAERFTDGLGAEIEFEVKITAPGTGDLLASDSITVGASSPSFTATTLRGLIDSTYLSPGGVQQIIDAGERNYQWASENIDNLEKLANAPFKGEDDLAAVQARLAEVNAILSGDNAQSDNQQEPEKTGAVEETGGRYTPDEHASVRFSKVTEPKDGESQVSVFLPAGSSGKRVRDVSSTLSANVDGDRIKHVEVGTFKFDGDARGDEMLAQIASPIMDEAQEAVVVIMLDGDRKPVAVLKHSVGTTFSATVEPRVVLGVAHSLRGVKHIVLAHNHPSGTMDLSMADRAIAKRLYDLSSGTGIQFDKIFAITPNGGYAVWSPETLARQEQLFTVPREDAEGAVPVISRKIANPTLAEPISSPAHAVDWVTNNAPGESGVLLLNTANVPVGFVPLSLDEMQKLRTGKKGSGASKILAAIDKTGATRSLIVALDAKTADDVQNLFTFLTAHETEALDVLMEDMVSAQNTHVWQQLIRSVNEYTPTQLADKFYSKRAVSGLPESKQADIRKELSALGRGVVRRLTRNGTLKIITQDEAAKILGDDYDNSVEGFVLPSSGTAYLVQGNIEKGKAAGILAHEIGVHVRRLGFKKEDAFKRILKMLRRRKKLDSEEGRAIRAAYDMVPDDIASRNVDEEALGYLVAQRPDISIVRRFIAAIKKFLVERLGFTPRIVKTIDLQAMAQSVLRADSDIKRRTIGDQVYLFAQNARDGIENAARKITSMPAFKRWFEGSKIIDNDGNPLVVYHGTYAKNFQSFDPTKLRSGASSLGFYFSSSRVANMFADLGGGSLMPVYLSIKNPYRLPADEFQEMLAGEMKAEEERNELINTISSELGAKITVWHDSVTYIDDNGHEVEVDQEKLSTEAQDALARLFQINNMDFRDMMDEFGWPHEQWVRFRDRLISEGYDGIVIDSEQFDNDMVTPMEELTDDNYIAFYPEQIKSIFNRGTFSPNTADIMKAVRQDERRMIKFSKAAHRVVRGTSELNVTVKGTRSPASADIGEQIIKEITQKLRTASTRRSEQKRISSQQGKLLKAYRKAAEIINDPHKSIAEKQKFAARFAQLLPVKPRAALLQRLSAISRYKTTEAQQRHLNKFLDRANAVVEEYLRREIVARIVLWTKQTAANKGKRGKVARGRGAELERDLKYLREVALPTVAVEKERARLIGELQIANEKLDTASDQQEIDRINEKIADLESKLYLLDIFGNIKGRSLEELIYARNTLAAMIHDGIARWRKVQESWQERNRENRERVAQEIAGEESPQVESIAEAARRIKWERSWRGRLRETVRAISNSIQSWEFMLDVITQKAMKGTLASWTVKHFSSLAHAATRAYERMNLETHDLLARKARRIFGVRTNKELAKVFAEAERVESGKVHLYIDGKKEDVPMSKAQAAYWYQISRDIANPVVAETFARMGITDKTLREIERYIGPQMKKWADYLVDEFYQDFHYGVNKVYRQVYGIDLQKTENYVPWKRDFTGKAADKEADGFLAGIESGSIKKGSLHVRVKNYRPYRIVSLNDVLMEHVADMNHFKAWAIPTREINGTFNSPKIRKLIRQHYGASALRQIKRFQVDFTKTDHERAGGQIIPWLDRLRGRITTAMVGGNPTIFLKQLTSFPAYAMTMPVKEWVKYTSEAVANPRMAARVLDQSVMLRARGKKGFERDVAMAMKKHGSQALTMIGGVPDLFMALTRLGDKAAIIIGGYATYQYTYDQAIRAGKSKQVARQEAIDAFEKATERTQQAGNVKDLGGFQRGGSLAKMFTMYMTAPASYTRQVLAAFRNMKASPVDSAKRLMIFGLVLPMLFQATADAFLIFGGDDDDKERFWWNQLRAVLLGPFNGVPLMRDIAAGMYNAIAGDYWLASRTTFSPMTDISTKGIRMTYNLGRYFRDSDSDILMSVLWDAAQIGGYLSGVPVRPIGTMATGLQDALEIDFPWRGWEPTDHPVRRALGYSQYVVGE